MSEEKNTKRCTSNKITLLTIPYHLLNIFRDSKRYVTITVC